jgi:hypothetical protein
MNTFLPVVAARAIGWWVTLYTLALPPDLQDDRRMEIRSDLWEQSREAARSGMRSRGLAWLMLRRLVLGVPADLAWRVEIGGPTSWPTGLVFATLGAIGFQLALRGPGVPDFDSSAREIDVFFTEHGAQMVGGHVLLWLSALVLVRLVIRIHRLVGDAHGGGGGLSLVVLSSGMAAGTMLVLTFVLTGIAAFQGATGDLRTMRTLYPLAGFVFHVPMSMSLAVFLAATADRFLRTRSLPGWAGPVSVILAAAFALESIGASPVYVLPQALFLLWAVAMSATMRGGAWTARQP